MDGIGSTAGVFVLGATNRPAMLDSALLRGGRLSRKIEIPSPDRPLRLELLQHGTARMSLAPDVALDEIAAVTDGSSGASLNALCQQAAMSALGRSDGSAPPQVARADFMSALEPGGQDRPRASEWTWDQLMLSDRTKRELQELVD